MKAIVDQLPRLGKRELICLLLFTCNYVVSVRRGFLFLWVLGMGHIILLWHALSLPYNYLENEFKHVYLKGFLEQSRTINCGYSGKLPEARYFVQVAANLVAILEALCNIIQSSMKTLVYLF